MRLAAAALPMDWADNILHLVLGAGMVGLGVTLGKEVARRDTAAPAL